MYFEIDIIYEIHEQAIAGDLHEKRQQLMIGVPKAYVADIDSGGSPSDQLLNDLAAMNETGPVSGDVVPFECWLRNAAYATRLQVDRQAFFKARLDELAKRKGSVTTLPVALAAATFNPARFAEAGPLMSADEFYKQICLIDRREQFDKILEKVAASGAAEPQSSPKAQRVLLLGPASERFDLFIARLQGPFLGQVASDWGFNGPKRCVPVEWTGSNFMSAEEKLRSYINDVLRELGLSAKWQSNDAAEASTLLGNYLQSEGIFLVCWTYYESEDLPAADQDFLGRCVDWWGTVSVRPGTMPPLAIFALMGAEQCAELQSMDEAEKYYAKLAGEKAASARRLPPLSRISKQHMSAWARALAQRSPQMNIDGWIEKQFTDAQKKMSMRQITDELEVFFKLRTANSGAKG